jgi:hypothetical protein
MGKHARGQTGATIITEAGRAAIAAERTAATQRKSSKEAIEQSSSVQEFRRIENQIMLNPQAMKELRKITEENDQYFCNGSQFSDIIIFLIQEYRKSHSSHDE